MIDIFKSSATSFILMLDISGVSAILSYMDKFIDHNGKGVDIKYKEKELLLRIFRSDDSYMVINGSSIEIHMDDDEIEYFEERLKKARVDNYFFPAEVCECKYKGKNVTIYCELQKPKA